MKTARQSIQDMQIILLSIFADISLFNSLPLHARVSVSGSGDYDGLAPRYITPESRGALPVIRSGPNRARGARVVRFDTTRGSPAMIDTVGSAFLSCPSSTSTIEVSKYVIVLNQNIYIFYPFLTITFF
jgi:hypothetical protein